MNWKNILFVLMFVLMSSFVSGYDIGTNLTSYYTMDLDDVGIPIINDVKGSNDGYMSGYTFYNGTIEGGVSNGTTNLTSDLLHYYKEDTSGSFEDSVGSNDCTWINSPTFTSSGKINGAYNFDGVNEYVYNNSLIDLSSQTNITISVWMKPTASNDYAGLAIGTKKSGLIYIRQRPDGYFQAGMEKGTGNYKSMKGNSAYSLNTWYHLVAIYTDSTVQLYINNVEQTTPSSAGSIDFSDLTGTASDNLYVGGIGTQTSYDDINEFFDGYIDEVGIWNSSLNTTEINELYNSGLGNQYPFSVAGGGNFTTDSAWGKYALSFDGVDDYVNIVDSDELTVQNYTISNWINTTQISDSDYIFKNSEYIIRLKTTGTIECLNYAGSSWRYSGQSTTSVNDGLFHLITCSYDGSYQRVYVDGVEENNNSATGLIPNGASDLKIGRKGYASSEFNGSLDKITIYNRSLSSSEISSMYVNGTVSGDRLISQYDFESGAGVVARDTNSFLDTKVLKETQYFDGVNNAGGGNQIILNTPIREQVITFSTWLSTATNTDVNYIFSADTRLRIYLINAVPHLQYYDGSFKSLIGNPISSNELHYIVFEKSNITGTKIYVDGVLDVQDASQTGNIIYYAPYDTRIGTYRDNYFFNGSINEVGIWNRSLDSWEISALYNGSNGLSHTNLVGSLNLTNVSIESKELNSNNITWIKDSFTRHFVRSIGASSWNLSLNLSATYDGVDETLILCDDCNNLEFDGYIGTDIGFGHFSTDWTQVGKLSQSTSSTDFIDLSFSFTSNKTRTNISLGRDYTAPVLTKLLNYTSEHLNISMTDYINVTDSLSGLTSCLITWSHQETSSSFITNCTDNVSFPYAGVYDFSLQAYDLATNRLDLSSNFTVEPNNYAYFYDERSGNPLVGYNFTMTYPNSNVLNLTTDSKGMLNISSFNDNDLQIGTYNITLKASVGYVSPYSFLKTVNISQIPFNESYDVGRVNISVNIFYRTNGTVFNKKADVVLTQVFNMSTTNGSIGYEDLTITAGDYDLIVSSDGYFTEEKVLTYSGQEQLNVNVYLLEENNSNSGTLTVRTVDVIKRLIEGATVSLKEYDISSKSYIEVSECITNSDGECKFLIEVNTKSYIISATKIDGSNTLYSEAEPEIYRNDLSGGEEVIFAEELRTLTLIHTDVFTTNPIYNLNYNIVESFDNTTNISKIVTTFNTLDGSSIKICTQYFRYESGVKTNLTGGKYCVEGASGVVTPLVDFILNLSYSYVAEVYIETSSGNLKLESFRYSDTNSFEKTLELNALLNYFIIFLWVGIISLGFYTKNMVLVGVLAIIVSWLELLFFPSITILSVTAFKTIISLIFIYNARKREDYK